jgi:glc operon protein GlcG
MYSTQNVAHEEAMIAIDAIRQDLQKRGKAAVIVISDTHGEAVALLRMDGALMPSILVAQNKAFTAARQGQTTGAMAADAKTGGWSFAYYGDPRYIGWDGGVPVVVEGKVIGAIAVSGLTEEEDAQLARLGANAIYNHLSLQTGASK